MGDSHSVECNEITKTKQKFWIWCEKNNVRLTVTHIPGKRNVGADRPPRHFNDDTEWKLGPEIFKSLRTMLGMPVVDLFASRTKFQIKTFVSWRMFHMLWLLIPLP